VHAASRAIRDAEGQDRDVVALPLQSGGGDLGDDLIRWAARAGPKDPLQACLLEPAWPARVMDPVGDEDEDIACVEADDRVRELWLLDHAEQ
jgi:hypothetical protein